MNQFIHAAVFICLFSAPLVKAANVKLPSGEAPKDQMAMGRWSTGNKQGFGTAFEAYDSINQYSANSPTAPISKVWYTVAQGVLTETYWPTLDEAQVRDSQFLVTDGSTFLFEERRDSTSTVEWQESGVPAYKITNRDPKGRFQIEKTVFSDPDRDVVIQKIEIKKFVPGLKFYILHNPSVANTSGADYAKSSLGQAGLRQGLFASEGDRNQALLCDISFKRVSAAFEGPYDGYQDLKADFKMDYSYETASGGNVALMAWLDIPETVGQSSFQINLGFGHTLGRAIQNAEATLGANANLALSLFTSQWKGYLQRVLDLSDASRDGGVLFKSSVAVLKSMEDKTYEGSFVASPTIPWGEHVTDHGVVTKLGSRYSDRQTGGYHLVWPRDLYQMASTFMAIDDDASAIASLNRLKAVQFSAQDDEWSFGDRKHSKDGSFPQNFWVNGEVFWAGLQMDETSMPIILTYRLWQRQKIQPSNYWNMVQRAADFIADFGPWSTQERWEEAIGASPSTIAAEITALRVASELAKQAGDFVRAKRYFDTAKAWSSKPGDNVNTWTFTHTGGLGNGKYFIRSEGASFFDQIWNPDDNEEFYIANNGGSHREKDIVDAGFLELVRFGVRSSLDYFITESLPEVDSELMVNIPNMGPSFRRYNFDRYNLDDSNNGNQTAGMLWPLLTGERGHYELQKAIQSNLRPMQIDQSVVPYISAIESFSTASHMIPEQVWDYGSRAGTSTGSATPLGWSHAEYIKLLRSRSDQAVFDRLPIVGDVN